MVKANGITPYSSKIGCAPSARFLSIMTSGNTIEKAAIAPFYGRVCRMLSSAHVYSITRTAIHCGSS